MNEQQAKEALTDMLAGEIDPQTLDELEEYTSCSEQFAQYRSTLELAWGFSLQTAAVSKAPEMSDELKDTIYGSGEPKSNVIPLSLDTLDTLAAAGNGVSYTDDQDPDEKNN